MVFPEVVYLRGENMCVVDRIGGTMVKIGMKLKKTW